MERLKKDFGVRALIAVMVVILTYTLIFYLAYTKALPKESMIGLLATLNLVIGFYFGRSSAKTT